MVVGTTVSQVLVTAVAVPMLPTASVARMLSVRLVPFVHVRFAAEQEPDAHVPAVHVEPFTVYSHETTPDPVPSVNVVLTSYGLSTCVVVAVFAGVTVPAVGPAASQVLVTAVAVPVLPAPLVARMLSVRLAPFVQVRFATEHVFVPDVHVAAVHVEPFTVYSHETTAEPPPALNVVLRSYGLSTCVVVAVFAGVTVPAVGTFLSMLTVADLIVSVLPTASFE